MNALNLALVEPGRLPAALAERLVFGRLQAIADGELELRFDGQTHHFGRPARDGLRAVTEVHDPRLFQRLLLKGSIGAGEAFMDGHWSSPDLTKVLRVFARNAGALAGLELGTSRLGLALERLVHLTRRNTVAGSRRNIAAHYDLGNDFFARMLDPTMCYSSGVFDGPDSTLEAASERKLDRLCRMLDLRPGEHLVEIGTGWGAMAIWAARHYGVKVTTTTISKEQFALARERVRAAGLEDRVTVLCEDYRALTGTYDKLVSVEMIEAVGAEYLPQFFAKCAALVRPGGRVAIQAITIKDQYFERAAREVDFIKSYIFPGSCIPSPTALLQAATAGSDLRLKQFDDFGPHYARTLAEWRRNLGPHRAEVVARYGESFWRMWTYYLCLCEAGFAEDYIGVAQLGFGR